MHALKFKYIDLKSHFHEAAIALREAVFFRNLPNSGDLIHDDLESNGMHLVCLDRNKVVGAGRLNLEEHRAVISQMAISKAYQRRGIGASILKLLIKRSKEGNVRYVNLGARETAITFYEKFGFTGHGDAYHSKKTGIIHQQMILKIY